MENGLTETKLFVGNLAYSTTEADLRSLFAGAGRVITARLVKDRDSGTPRGFAFVTMGTPAEAQKAIGQFNAFSWAGRPLTVTLARKPDEHERRQGPSNVASLARQRPRTNTRQPDSAHGGFQSRYSAFGDRVPGPTRARRRGGGPRR
jgi:RNA recognition motif-containing protein